jgi:hypothetical protein
MTHLSDASRNATPVYRLARPARTHVSPTEAAKEWSTAELFWIVKHGVKMTGMPAFGPTHSDERLWTVVAFLKQLPQISPEKYTEMKQASAKHHEGHDEHTHDHDEIPVKK